MFEIRVWNYKGQHGSWIKVDSIVPATKDFPYWKITHAETVQYDDLEEPQDYAYFLSKEDVRKLEMRSPKEPSLEVIEGGEEDGSVSQTEVPVLLSEYRDREDT